MGYISSGTPLGNLNSENHLSSYFSSLRSPTKSYQRSTMQIFARPSNAWTADGQIKQSPGESTALSQLHYPRQSHKACPIRNISTKCPNGSELSKACPIRRQSVYQVSISCLLLGLDKTTTLGYTQYRVEKEIFLISALPVKATFRSCWVLKALTEEYVEKVCYYD